MAGSDESGEDMQSGRVNRAEDHTRIWAQQNQGQPFNGDAIFIVEAARDIEDDDFVRASSKLHAITGFGVSDGAGVVGVSSTDPDEGIPPVSKVGVFGKGATGVGGEGSPGVEGVGAANPFHVLAGAGVMGRGGRRSAPPTDDRKLHGPGVVGLGGSRSRDVEGADEIAGNVGVFGQGAEGEGARRPGAGVVGRGGAVDGTKFAPGVVGLTSTALDLGVMDPLDTGVFGRGGTGVTGQGTTGPGVRGSGGPGGPTGEISPEALQAGVVGQGGSGLAPGGRVIHGAGVIGLAGDLRALPYAEAGETGVYGAGQIGVKGVGSDGRGGVFASNGSAQIQLLPAQRARIVEQESFIPTVATDPGRLGPPLPPAGRGGDLMALTDDQGQCSLWFCVRGGSANTAARWAQVLLGPAFDGRN